MPTSFVPIPVEAPGGFAPVAAIGHCDDLGNFCTVSSAHPLPTVALAPSVPAALAGQVSGTIVVGPFKPAPLAPVFVTLDGDWTGQVQVVRSTDGGATRHPLTLGGAQWASFGGNACEPVWIESEADAALYLDILLDAGTLVYRVSQ